MVVLVRGTLVIVVVSVAACGLRWRGLVDGRLEVEVWTMSGRHSRRREGRAHHGRAWRMEGARCCEVRGVASLEEVLDAFLHVLNAALLGPFACATVPLEVIHVGVEFL